MKLIEQIILAKLHVLLILKNIVILFLNFNAIHSVVCMVIALKTNVSVSQGGKVVIVDIIQILSYTNHVNHMINLKIYVMHVSLVSI